MSASQTSSTRSSARSARGRRTCLYCYAPFRVERGTQACPDCGAEQSRLDQERWWTREARFVGIEKGLKVGALLLTALLGVVLTQVMDVTSLPWGIGLLAALGGLLWYTAGCVTRRASFMDLRFLWPPLLVCIAFGPLVISELLRWIGGEQATASGEGALRDGFVWALPWLPAIALSFTIPGLFARLRRERVDAESDRSEDPA